MRVFALLFLAFLASGASAIDFSNRYRSPRNAERRVRKSTELIVLHTTEAPARSSLNKLCERGEAHYCVTEDGTVYRIVDRDRVAFHAGRSMWNGKEDADEFSIGIECVGYHDKAMGIVQIRAIRDLVKELQRMYRIPDERVVCHSHVAYGAPNRWQKKNHRGRKRCGMLFAMPSVRAQLNLARRPASDADVRAKRLVVGDDYLRRVLYGNVDTMKSSYPKTPSPSRGQEGGGLLAWLRGDAKKPDTKKPDAGKTQISAKDPPEQKKLVPAPVAPVPPQAPPKSIAELKSRGYVFKGSVTKGVTASKIAGGRWNSKDTYYTIRNKVIPGDAIDPAHIENGMGVWMK
ncbi:MAG: N-acetylmuramoyl-L-alanine amidase [Kiritimatiellae bacterium]|nr:N-acetylmuramoyl-L-alanine amidase [Kiritimatiellia bacterium]